jgi:hypothetical protein
VGLTGSESCRGVVMKRIVLGTLVCSVFFYARYSPALFAQNTAQINGTVTDPTGAVLPGVEITATQTATSLVRTVVTNETGAYALANLPIGPYRLEAVLPGFRTFSQSGIVLQVGTNPVINISLEVGQVTETVEVQADAALVETRTTGVGQVIDNVRVMELPLSGRQVTELIILSGAAVGGGQQNSPRNYPTDIISVGGGSNNGLTFLLDGGLHNDPYGNQSLPLPFPDALQEFKVETSAVPAMYGFHAAGAVNVVTKSGTNDITAACSSSCGIECSMRATHLPPRRILSNAISLAASSVGRSCATSCSFLAASRLRINEQKYRAGQRTCRPHKCSPVIGRPTRPRNAKAPRSI